MQNWNSSYVSTVLLSWTLNCKGSQPPYLFSYWHRTYFPDFMVMLVSWGNGWRRETQLPRCTDLPLVIKDHCHLSVSVGRRLINAGWQWKTLSFKQKIIYTCHSETLHCFCHLLWSISYRTVCSYNPILPSQHGKWFQRQTGSDIQQAEQFPIIRWFQSGFSPYVTFLNREQHSTKA